MESIYYSSDIRRNKKQRTTPKQKPKKSQFCYKTPKELKDLLDNTVIGQEKAKKAICVAFSNHLKRLIIREDEPDSTIQIDKSNLLLIGPTGSGKTLMVKTLAKVVGLPYALGDATSLTEAGYVGDDVETLLSTLLKNTPNKGSKNEPDIEIAERGIIFIDEIDKISKTGQSQSVTRDVSGEGVQQALLKMVEGSVVRVQPVGSRKHPESDCISVDTSQILFIAAGSFVGLDQIIDRRLGNCSMGFSRAEKKTESLSIMPDDLIEFGMIPEFVGRFHNVEKLEKLTKEQLKSTMIDTDNSIIGQYKKLADFEGCQMSFTDDFIDLVAKMAYDLDIGARGVRQIMERILSPFFFDLPRGKLIISEKKAQVALGIPV